MNRIYLIGYMGSGKSTIGRAMSKTKKWNFLDLDDLIESRSGWTIPELFRHYGEEAFRELEASALHHSFTCVKTIIATGGGTPCFYDNITLMLQHGLVIYLKGSSSELINRVKKDPSIRPILEGKSDREVSLIVEEQLSSRSKFYEQAHHVVAIDKDGDRVVQEILQLI